MATTQKRKSNKFIYWLIGVLGILLLLVIVGKSQGWIGKPQELEVELAKVKRTTIVEKVSASGTVQPVIEVKIAPEVSGEIRELLIEEGDSVGKNQMLVKIRPDTWLSQLDRAEASLNQQKANVVSAEAALSRAEASLTRAMQEYKRQESLHDQRLSPKPTGNLRSKTNRSQRTTTSQLSSRWKHQNTLCEAARLPCAKRVKMCV